MKLNKVSGWVGLEGIEVKGPVGIYEAEQKKGTNLLIDLYVYGKIGKAIKSDSIENSMNYELLASISADEVNSGSALLETLAYRILSRVLKEIPKANKAKIKVRKQKPQMDNTVQSSVVELSMKR